MTNLSIIIPCFNNLDYSRDCINSILRNTTNFELILINNGSNDGTRDYFKLLTATHSFIKVIDVDHNLGFSAAVNLGIDSSLSDFICILNNDTIVTPHWSVRMINHLRDFSIRKDDNKIAFVGPVSNNASGIQSVEISDNDIRDLDAFSESNFQTNINKQAFSNFLSGFCFIGKSEAFKSVGHLDERFKFGGFEDNDFFLRATLSGLKCMVDPSVFIYHHGQRTLSLIPDYQKNLFFPNCVGYTSKYSDPSRKVFCIILRVKNGAKFLPRYLNNISLFCNTLVVVDNESTDKTSDILLDNTHLKIYYQYFEGFDERRDRQHLLSTAYELGFDWALSLDIDELMPDYITPDYFQNLMHPVNPEILAYSFIVYTFFESEKYIRQDPPWNYLMGIRFFRLFPYQKVDFHGKAGLHCSHSPSFSPVNTRHTSQPILHLGYINSDIRKAKSDFYNSIDSDPFQPNIGPFGYKHLTTSEILLAEYNPDNTISLAILTDDNGQKLFNCLYNHTSFFSEIHVLHTGKSPEIADICTIFNANYYQTKFRYDFSRLRNKLKSLIKTKWILFLDTDEVISYSDFSQISQMTLRDVDGYLFIVWNYQPNGTVIFSDNVRLIRNTDKIYFTHPIHESVSESVRVNHLAIVPSPIPIKHFGFLEDQSIKSKKSSLYLSILKGQAVNHPTDPSTFFHLSFHYFENNDIPAGIYHLAKCVDLDPKFFLAHKELGLRYVNMAIDHLQKCLDSIPEGHYYFDYISRVFDYISKVNFIEFKG